jgi:hypothetical protein
MAGGAVRPSDGLAAGSQTKLRLANAELFLQFQSVPHHFLPLGGTGNHHPVRQKITLFALFRVVQLAADRARWEAGICPYADIYAKLG